MKQSKTQLLFAIALVVVAMASRLAFNALHIYNFSAVMASAFFAGAYFSNKRLSFAIPLVTMLLTDLVIGVYDWKLMAVVDGAFLLSIVLGQLYARKASLLGWISVVLGGSTLFFLVTNAAVWLFGDGTFYPHTVEGLMQSYTMGLPFFRDRLIGDLTWSAVLFGSYELFRLRSPKQQLAPKLGVATA